MFRRIRILVLLLILLFLGLGTLLDRFHLMSWKGPVVVALYPINADGSNISEAYISKLKSADFASIESFFADEAREYKLALDKPIEVTLAPVLRALPPKPPA